MAGKAQQVTRDETVTEVTDVQPQTPFQQMLRAMQMEATAEVENARFNGDDLNVILTASTEDELWESDEQGPLNAQHLAGCEVGIMDVNVKFSRAGRSDSIESSFVTTDGKKMYLMVTAVRLSDAGEKAHLRLPAVGEVFVFNTSARYLTTKIWAFYIKGYISQDTGKVLEAVIRETDLGDGQAVLKLRPMPRRAVRTETV